jgi:hypothetical protein
VTDDDIAEFNDTWTLDTPEWMTNLWTSLSVSITMPGTWFIMSLLILGMCDRFGAGNLLLVLLPIFPLLLAKIDVPPSAKCHPYFCLLFFFFDRLGLEISCLVNVLLMTATIYVMRWYRRAFTPPARFRNTSNYGSCSPILRVNLAQVLVVRLVPTYPYLVSYIFLMTMILKSSLSFIYTIELLYESVP